jgi:hypothetical protein
MWHSDSEKTYSPAGALAVLCVGVSNVKFWFAQLFYDKS